MVPFRCVKAAFSVSFRAGEQSKPGMLCKVVPDAT